MLDPWIIEEIRRREDERRREREAQRIEKSIESPDRDVDAPAKPPAVERGVVVIDL